MIKEEASGRRRAVPTAALQVRAIREHGAAVTDLSLDASAEYLGSAAQDGSIAVHGLHSEEALRLAHPQPVLVRSAEAGGWPLWKSQATTQHHHNPSYNALPHSSSSLCLAVF